MGFFDGVEGLDPAGNTPRFPEGNYIVRVCECRVNQGQWGLRFIVECDVLQSDQPNVPEGSKRSWTCQIDGSYKTIGLSEAKAFAGACMGLMDKDQINAQVTSQTLDWAVSQQQPFAGRVLRTQATTKQTNTGNEITKHNWYPIDPTEAATLGIDLNAQPANNQMPASPPPGYNAPPPPQQPQGGFQPPPMQPPPQQPQGGFQQPPQQPQGGFQPPPMQPPQQPPQQPQGGFQPPPMQPPTPPQQPPSPPAQAFPPPGWTKHPDPAYGDYYYKGQDVVTSAQLRERMAHGTA